MKERTFESIGIKRLSIEVDGHGVNTLVCGHHCPLKCRYCLNPQCLFPPMDTTEYTVKQLIDKLSVDSLYYEATGGGITFGGGEPLLQAAFIHAFAKAKPDCWGLGIETSLSTHRKMVELLLDDVNYWMVDVKSMNPEIYERYTIRPIDNMLENLGLLLDNVSQDKIMVKVPLIPGYSDADDVRESAEILSEMGFTDIRQVMYAEPDDEHKRLIELITKKKF